MELRTRVPKHEGAGPHREVPVTTTLERLRPYLRTLGITRIADITGLDRVGIPVYNAIMPRSQERLSVYNGKGSTPADATASAVMEAVERFCAWQPTRADAIGSYADLAASGRAVMDPAAYNLALEPRYHPDLPICWVEGFDLMEQEPVLVPQCLAGYYHRFHEIPCYTITTSNGIASGNTLEEAVCHALAEVLERDDWTMAELVGDRLRRTIRMKLGAAAPPDADEWLAKRNPGIDLNTLPPSAQRYVEAFQRAGVRVVLKYVAGDGTVPTIAALTTEDGGGALSAAHGGYGTHPDAEVAVARALTEVAQSRAVDIQGMREDLSQAGDRIADWDRHAARSASVDLSAWPYDESAAPVKFGDLPSSPGDDIAADIAVQLAELRRRGLRRAIVVDRSLPGLPVAVARVIVPGAESYGVDRSRLGPRANARWDAELRELIRRRDQGAAGEGRERGEER
ncbi:YcaO-like family protein [Thermopolyspora sp. NPDC052614]|uniref:YcaO-like family protein n=1 Tax=Thermopolyspora sp. NPDC052614 TaxID=3155682 RepID=UPI0034461176